MTSVEELKSMLDGLKTSVENILARVMDIEGLDVQAKLDAISATFMAVDQEVTVLKGNIAARPNKGKKEILESKAIQNLGQMSNAKEYRQWNQRLNNALDQARPESGRKVMSWLESITENMVTQQKKLSVAETMCEVMCELLEPRGE